jgi:hypothetical protein
MKMKIRKYLFLLLPLVLAGCAGLIRTEQPFITDWVPLSAGHPVGQTFVAKYAGLSGIYFYLSPSEIPAAGEIRLHLRSDPTAETDLAVSTNSLASAQVGAPSYFGFFVPPQTGSNQQYYYAWLEYSGSGSVLIGKSAGDSYLNGALYQDGDPVDAQASFQLSYSRRRAFLGLGLEGLGWIGILAAAFFLFVLPGWGLFSLLWPSWNKLTWPEKLGLSAGLSLAIYPLLILWTNLIGLRLGAGYAWLPPLLGLSLLIWHNRNVFRTRLWKSYIISALRSINFPKILPDLLLLIFIGLIIFSRFWSVRSLEAPMGADSLHHTLISQLIINNAGLFSTWQPYTDLSTFTYHFGFHTCVAVFYWLTHMETTKAVLWVGQIFNVLAVIVLYPLAIKLVRSRWAGAAAVLVAGLLSPMPMYYTNWGRYTQLAGQVILPAAVWILWEFHTGNLSTPLKKSKGMLAVAVLLMGGLALTHYRILILALLFLAVLWLMYARRQTFRQMFFRTLGVGLPAALLFLPWFIRVFGGRIMVIFAHRMTLSAARAVEVDMPHSGGTSIAFFLPYIIWLGMALAMLLGAWLRSKSALLLALWWFANLVAAYPSWLGLPGAGVISGDAIAMAAYIPAAVFVGALLGWLDEFRFSTPSLNPKIRVVLYLIFAFILVGAGIWGVPQRRDDLHTSSSIFVFRPDARAAAWIQENTPSHARFLVNSFLFLNNTTIVGSDAGYWLPMLAIRPTSVPPLIYGFEAGTIPGYIDYVNTLTREIQSKGIQDATILSELRDRQISYLYIGQRQGVLSNNAPLFTAAQLLSDPAFHLVYHQDRVWIFQIP